MRCAMQTPSLFLRSKLLPPRQVPDTVFRPRLIERLRSNLSEPVTIITAEAGCGKTTLVAEFVRSVDRPLIWYQLDHTDADPVVFFGYLGTGIANAIPDFKATFANYLSSAGEELSFIPESSADLLLNEIANAAETPFIIVLDDYHYIGRETNIHKIVDRLIQYSSDLFHLIITSRDVPPLSVARRRTQHKGIHIKREELLFTEDELRELFRSTLQIEMDDGQVSEYRTRTHGWITALQLIRQTAERQLASNMSAPELDLGELFKRSELDIFDYFAEEVIAYEQPQTNDLLMRLSLLESMPIALCGRLFPNSDTTAILPELARRNLFIASVGNGQDTEEYRFHPLFKDFLIRRFRIQAGPDSLARERVRIAKELLKSGNWEAALSLFIEAEDFHSAAEVIENYGPRWIASGAFTLLSSLAERVPMPILELHPASLLPLAEAARLRGDLDKASLLANRAARCLEGNNDRFGEAEALHLQASVLRRKNEYAAALEVLTRATELAEPRSETLLKCANTRGLCLIATGNLNEAEQQFRIAMEIAEYQANEKYIRLVAHNLALVPGFRGDFSEALKWFRKIFRDPDGESQLPQEAIGHLNMGRLLTYRGEMEKAEQHLEKALELCQLFNLRGLKGEIFEALANLYRDQFKLEKANEYYERALNSYEEAEIDSEEREFIEERAKYYRLAGDRSRARELLERAIERRALSGNVSGARTAETWLCRLDLEESRTEGLSEKISELVEFFRAKGNCYDEAIAVMLLAECCLNNNDFEKMVSAIHRVLDLSSRYDYEFWLKGEMTRIPEAFRHEGVYAHLPRDLKIFLDGVQESTEKIRAVPDQTRPGILISSRGYAELTLKLLGKVEIFRSQDSPFAADAWTTKRARDILCFIVTSTHRRASRDTIIDNFWRDEDLTTIEKNFHPTISHIRKALNSGQLLKQNFLLFREGSYFLNPDLTYSIDTEEFDIAIASAEKAKRDKEHDKLREELQTAYSLYRGDFMEGSYDDWVDERRQYYQEQFSRVLAALAKQAFSGRMWNQTMKYCEELFAIDPYREDIHRLFMKTLAAQGKRAAVKLHFDKMAMMMRNELGITPSAETRKVLAELAK